MLETIVNVLLIIDPIDQEHVTCPFSSKSASWTRCSQSWMKPGFSQRWKILPNFLQLFEHIDQEPEKNFFLENSQDQLLEHVAPNAG